MGQAETTCKLRYLIIAGLSSTLVYAAVMLRLPLYTMYTTSLRNFNQIPVSELPFSVLVVVCLAVLFGGYALGAVLVPSVWHRHLAQVALVGFPVAFAAAVLFTYPITSTDIYDYLFRGWMLAHYNTNTLATPPEVFPRDPLLPYVAWPWAVSAYGPLWERMSWVTAALAGEAAAEGGTNALLLSLMIGYKVLNIIGFVLCGAAIWAALGGADPRWRWQGVYLWLWNPLVLWETIGAAHNDVWMALPIVLALWAVRIWQETPRRYDLAQRVAPVVALLALTAGGLVKFIAFFFGPLVLMALVRGVQGWRARGRLIAISCSACVALMVVAYWPFWAGWDTFRNISDRGALYTSSWLASLRGVLVSVVGIVQANRVSSVLGLALLLAGIIWTAQRVWREPARVVEDVLMLTLWFLVACNPWAQPWYLVWAVALVAMLPWWQRATWAISVFSATSMVSYIVGALALPLLSLDRPVFLRELIVSLWLYGPPLAVLFAGRQPSGRALTRTSGSAIMDGASPRSSGG